MVHLKRCSIEAEFVQLISDVAEDAIAQQDLGQVASPHYLKHIPVPQSSSNPQSSNVVHATSHAQASDGQAMDKTLHSGPIGRLPQVKKVQTLASELANVQHAYLCQNLERRLEVARHQGNEALIQLLEAERENIQPKC
jgi:hypothetical protein